MLSAVTSHQFLPVVWCLGSTSPACARQGWHNNGTSSSSGPWCSLSDPSILRWVVGLCPRQGHPYCHTLARCWRWTHEILLFPCCVAHGLAFEVGALWKQRDTALPFRSLCSKCQGTYFPVKLFKDCLRLPQERYSPIFCPSLIQRNAGLGCFHNEHTHASNPQCF